MSEFQRKLDANDSYFHRLWMTLECITNCFSYFTAHKKMFHVAQSTERYTLVHSGSSRLGTELSCTATGEQKKKTVPNPL